ncbi:MAG: DsbA family protein [Minisyncoccia bacterium]
MEQKTQNNWLVPISIIVAGLLIAVSIIYAINKNPMPTTAPNNQQNNVDVKTIKTNGTPIIGKPDAPVTIAYWFDYQCPFCKDFELNTLPQIMTNYVDSGKVKIIFKDLQFLDFNSPRKDSQIAGYYEHAIWDLYPDKFITWRQAMFDKQDGENSGWGSEDDIINLIKTIPGIDVNKVIDQVKNNKTKYQNIMDASKQEAFNNGIQGTPGFIINKVVIAQDLPYSQFSQIIDQQLSNNK